MDTLKTLTDKVNNKLENSNHFFLSSEIERGVGLETILKNYHIISYKKDGIYNYLKENSFNVFAPTQNDSVKSSARLLANTEVLEYITKQGKGTLQTFKISPQFKETADKIGLDVLNTTPELNKLFEDKIQQFEVLKDKGVSLKKTVIGQLDQFNFESLVKELQLPFVIQFSRGHTGSGTKIIENKDDFNKLQNKFPKRTARISEYIDSDLIYTVNGCITEQGTYWGGLNFQITGVRELTHLKGATVGNDYSIRNGIKDNNWLITELNKISNVMLENGFRGLFGVDFIIKGDNFYLIEINARQTASVPFHTKLQLLNNQIPLSLIHLAQFLEIEFAIDIDSYNQENLKAVDASQVFIRAKEEFTVGADIITGIYRLQSDNTAMRLEQEGQKDKVIYLDEEKDKPLILQKRGYSIDQVENGGGMIIMARPRGEIIKPGGEIARIQLLTNSISNNLTPLPVVIQILKGIKNYIR